MYNLSLPSPPQQHKHTAGLSASVSITALHLIMHNCNNWSLRSADMLTDHRKRHVFSRLPITHADLLVFIQY